MIRKLHFKVLFTMLMLFISYVGWANIWMDENFDGTAIFVQGNGGGDTVSPPNATLDIYSYNTVANSISNVLTQTGEKVTSKFLDGTACYRIQAGQTLAVGTAYQDPRNGNFQIFQFGINVDPIPSAGDVAIFRYNWDTDDTTGPSPDYSFYVKLVSTGSAVNIIAGEDVKNSPADEAQIGTLNSASEWKFITLVMQNSTDPATYPSENLPPGHTLNNVAESVRFYCSSTSIGHTVAMTGNGPNKKGLGWAFTVSNGTVYVDTIYWEGGMDNTTFIDDTDEAKINIRPFNYAGTTSVSNWSLY